MDVRYWLLLFVQKFREVLASEEYNDYKEFFQSFLGEITCLTLEPLENYWYGSFDTMEIFQAIKKVEERNQINT